ncbi:DMT family transporter [Helicobacter pametensis]|uniref:DMT family transporter n=1 Tax=Helicobacter pametensis TaxID=95149 RepID=UPI000CF0B37F|nr:DMT family transporter [Helicobacter pametensis]
MNFEWRFVFLALLAEAFIIYASVLVKVIDLSPIMTGFYRVALAAPIFGLLALRKANIFKTPTRDMLLMILAGVLFGLDLVFFNLALHRTSVANANLFASLVCFILVPIGAIFFGERVRSGFIIGACVSFIGVVMLVKGKGGGSVATPIGDLYAFVSMVCYSIFLALVFGLRKKYDTMHLFFFASLGSSLMLLGLGGYFEGFSTPKDLKNWGILALIVLCGQVLGQGFFGYIMGKIPAQISSLLLLFSPIIAAVMGYVFLGEMLGWVEIAGIFVIIFGVYLAQKKKK